MSTEVGRLAEDLAAQYLEERGLQVVSRNWRSRWSEIDIIAQSNQVIHFIEVKYRRTAYFGSGLAQVTADKQHRLARAAQVWMAQHGQDRPFQIDVISIEGPLDRPAIDYVENVVN